MNIRKRQLYVKGILAQDLGVVWGPFWGGLDGFRGGGGGGRFQRSSEACQAVWRLLRAHRLLPPPLPALITIESRHPRGSLDPDEGDRRSGGVERNDLGRILSALIRSGSGQAGHGPWG